MLWGVRNRKKHHIFWRPLIDFLGKYFTLPCGVAKLNSLSSNQIQIHSIINEKHLSNIKSEQKQKHCLKFIWTFSKTSFAMFSSNWILLGNRTKSHQKLQNYSSVQRNDSAFDWKYPQINFDFDNIEIGIFVTMFILSCIMFLFILKSGSTILA